MARDMTEVLWDIMGAIKGMSGTRRGGVGTWDTSLPLKHGKDSTWQQFGTQGWLGYRGDTWGLSKGTLGCGGDVWGCNGAKLGCSGDSLGQDRDTLGCSGVILGHKDFQDTKENFRSAWTVVWYTMGTIWGSTGTLWDTWGHNCG